MSKRMPLALLFLGLIAITLALGLFCNTLTPVLHLDMPITGYVAQRIHAVDLNPLRGESEVPTITFQVDAAIHPLSMLVSGTTPFRAYSGAQLLYQYDGTSHAQRMHVFSLPHSAFVEGMLVLTFEIENGLSRADILIGNDADITFLASSSDHISMLILGMLLMIMLYSLSLYIAKSSERYLAILAAVSALTTLVFLNDMSTPLLHLPRWLSEPIRNFSQVGPGYIFAVVLLLLCRFELPDRLSFLTKRPIHYMLLGFAFTMLLSLNRSITYVEPIARIVFIAVMAFLLCSAHLKKEKGTLLLVGGYAIFHGLGGCFDIIKHLHLVTGGTLPVLVRLPQLGNLVFLICATVKISFRFAENFNKAIALAHQLDALNFSLDSKVAERTQQLADQQTQKHRLMLNIFHDLRSPIFIIQGCLRKIRKENLPGMPQEEFDILSDRVGFIDKLTEDLFTIAKLEENDLLLAMDTANFSAICQRQCEAAAIAAAEKGLRFHFSLLSGLFVWGDQLRLGQAIQNLLINAITYTPAGGSIHVCMAQEEDACTLSIRDTGPGIAPEDIPHIFSRYYCIDRAENRKSTGLGLSIANEITDLHKGSLQVESEKGRGTVFCLSLPLLTQ